MKITVSESNQIIQFIRRWRRFMQNDWAPFPDDICSLTWVFIGYLIVVLVLGFFAALTAFILGFTIVVWIYGAVDGEVLFIAGFGTLFWGGLIALATVFAHKRLVDGGYIDPPKKGPSIGERITTSNEWRLLREMFRSVKDKTCIRVDVQK